MVDHGGTDMVNHGGTNMVDHGMTNMIETFPDRHYTTHHNYHTHSQLISQEEMGNI